MSDMFIPKKEKIKIIIEAVIYVAFVIAASYFTIFGNMFIRMIPMIYFLGILGNMMFNKPVVTIILTSISVCTFGCITEGSMNMNVILFVVYSVAMLVFGIITGYILNELYENFKLRKFIKYYTKIAYIIGVVFTVTIPLLMNNLVNSNMITYIIAKNKIDEYVKENYAYSDYYINKVEFIPSYNVGTYEFNTIIDDTCVKLNYTLDDEISDVNMLERKETLDKMLNAEINILLYKNHLQTLNVTSKYEYSKIATIPDSINISVANLNENNLDDAVMFITILKNWEKFEQISRINIELNGKVVSINKADLTKKNITKEYILNGIQYELLDSKEGI